MNLISSNLVYLRKSKGLKSYAFAAKMGIKPTTYSNYETGASTPDMDTLLKISKFHGVTLEDLTSVEFKKDKPPKSVTERDEIIDLQLKTIHALQETVDSLRDLVKMKDAEIARLSGEK